jgi:8-oxo-dGTP diphosphatase
MHTHWNLRVYFLLCSPDNQALLISNEIIRGSSYFKLPGGGVEFGEGIAEAARREAIEELGVPVVLEQAFYFTDDYIPSLFKPDDQVIAFYYKVTSPQIELIWKQRRFSAKDGSEQTFEWIPFEQINPEQFTLASDKVVLQQFLQTI